MIARIREWISVNDAESRRSLGMLEAWVSIGVNIIIAAIKMVYGVLANSVGLIADAVHSLSDVLSSGVVLIGFRIAGQPPDEEHPFGHGRMELITAVIMATLLAAVGLEFLVDGISRVRTPAIGSISINGLIVVGFTLVLKEGLARFSIWIGHAIQSQALIADGQHHRSDALSTVVVILSLVGVRMGFPWLDGAGAIVVAGFILFTAIELLRDATSPLLGQRPSGRMLQTIREIADAHPGVIGIHDIVVHDFQSIYNVSLHIEVDQSLSLVRAHEISDSIERKIQERYPGWTVVHVDPVDRSHPMYPAVVDLLSDLAGEYPFMDSVHDIRIVGSVHRFNIVFDVNAPGGEQQKQDIREVKERIRNGFPECGVVITVDPPVPGNP